MSAVVVIVEQEDTGAVIGTTDGEIIREREVAGDTGETTGMCMAGIAVTGAGAGEIIAVEMAAETDRTAAGTDAGSKKIHLCCIIVFVF